MRRRHHLIAVVLFTFGSVPALYAEDFVVAPGEPWPKPEEISAGDRILFTPGAHAAKSLRGLRGTAEAPIVIDVGSVVFAISSWPEGVNATTPLARRPSGRPEPCISLAGTM